MAPRCSSIRSMSTASPPASSRRSTVESNSRPGGLRRAGSCRGRSPPTEHLPSTVSRRMTEFAVTPVPEPGAGERPSALADRRGGQSAVVRPGRRRGFRAVPRAPVGRSGVASHRVRPDALLSPCVRRCPPGTRGAVPDGRRRHLRRAATEADPRRTHLAASPNPHRPTRPPRWGNGTCRRTRTDRAHHPRSPVPHPPRVPERLEAPLPVVDRFPARSTGDGRRGADRLRATNRHRRVRERRPTGSWSFPTVSNPHSAQTHRRRSSCVVRTGSEPVGCSSSRRSPIRTRAMCSCSR